MTGTAGLKSLHSAAYVQKKLDERMLGEREDFV